MSQLSLTAFPWTDAAGLSGKEAYLGSLSREPLLHSSEPLLHTHSKHSFHADQTVIEVGMYSCEQNGLPNTNRAVAPMALALSLCGPERSGRVAFRLIVQNTYAEALVLGTLAQWFAIADLSQRVNRGYVRHRLMSGEAWPLLKFVITLEAESPEQAKPASQSQRTKRAGVLERVYNLDQTNKELTLDTIFEWFDEHFQAEQYAECDALLDQMDVEKLSISALIGVLSVTLTSKCVLGARVKFFDRVRARLCRERPNDVDKLLHGLE